MIPEALEYRPQPILLFNKNPLNIISSATGARKHIASVLRNL